MEENSFITLGNDLLTGNKSENINIEGLINAPTNDKNMIMPFNISDISKSVAMGDPRAGKIKVLCIPSDKTGVGKYRSIDPHRMLHKLFKEDFYVEINPEPDYNNMEYFKKFNIVHIHKAPSNDYNNGVAIIERLKNVGCTVILDMDDYWKVESFNPHYYAMRKYEIDKKLLEILKCVDWVTTTTQIFADEIRKYNKNVVVIPNAIDPEEPQFKPQPVTNERLRVGYLGGSSHLLDIELLTGLTNRLIPYQDKIQLVLVGFDLRGSIIERVDKTGRMSKRAMKPEETVWHQYEKIFTSNYALLNQYPDYVQYLKKYTQDPYMPENPEIEMSMPYRRIWTRDINNYARNYNHLDISLAPLVENKFNSVKSQLKVVESGFYGKAIVAQNFGPYTLDLIHIQKDGAINPKGNAYLVDSRKNHKEWFQGVKFLIDRPEVRIMMAENLQKTVNEKFDLRKITEQRAEFYRTLPK